MEGPLPKLYMILDAALTSMKVTGLAREMFDAGVRLFQYRNKNASAREVLRTASALTKQLIPQGSIFFVNDRPDIAALAGASGAHLGQEDLSPEDGRLILEPSKLLGISTHNREQFEAALKTSADYIAVGPIFATGSKSNPDPVVGTELLKELRPLTEKPIVAIGGITLERTREVIEAGANSVAVIGDILSAPDPAERARQFLEVLETPRTRAAN